MAGGFAKKGTTTPSKPVFGARQSQQKTNSSSAKQNKSILNFFQKTDGPPPVTSRQPRITQFTGGNGSRGGRGRGGGSSASLRRDNTSSGLGSTTEGLFLEDHRGGKTDTNGSRESERARSRTPDDIWGEDEEEGIEKDVGEGDRYNETGSAVKKRKVASVFEENDDKKEEDEKPGNHEQRAPAKPSKTSGPFIDESDSEEEDLDAFREVEEIPTSETLNAEGKKGTKDSPNSDPEASRRASPNDIPPLVREATSHIGDDEYANFDDLDEGEEEFLEPLSPAGNECEEEAVCPICQSSLVGLGEMVGLPFTTTYCSYRADDGF